jgi:hypothetical protein
MARTVGARNADFDQRRKALIEKARLRLSGQNGAEIDMVANLDMNFSTIKDVNNIDMRFSTDPNAVAVGRITNVKEIVGQSIGSGGGYDNLKFSLVAPGGYEFMNGVFPSEAVFSIRTTPSLQKCEFQNTSLVFTDTQLSGTSGGGGGSNVIQVASDFAMNGQNITGIGALQGNGTNYITMGSSVDMGANDITNCTLAELQGIKVDNLGEYSAGGIFVNNEMDFIGTSQILNCPTITALETGKLDKSGALYVNSYYVNDNVNDIQTVVDSVGADQGNVIYVSAGSYGGSTLTLSQFSNSAIICPAVGEIGRASCRERV